MKVATVDVAGDPPGALRFTALPAKSGTTRLPPVDDARAFDGVDLVVWDAAPMLTGAFERIEPDGRGVLSPIDSYERLMRSRALRDALRRFQRRAGTLAVLLPAAGALGVHTLQEVVDFEPLESLPDRPPRLAPLPADAASGASGGVAWEATAGEPFASFFRAVDGLLAPSSVIADEAGRPIAALRARPEIVAAYRYTRPGRLLLLPAVRAGLATAAAETLVSAIRVLTQRLAAADLGTQPPDWWLDAPPADEASLTERVASQARALVEAQDALDRTSRELADLRRVGALAWGDREAVARALTVAVDRFGAYVQPIGDEGEVVVERDGRVGVVVIVGPRPAADAVGAALTAAERIGADLGVPVRPILLPIGEHAVPIAGRSGPDAPWRDAAARAGVVLADGPALLRAWREGDASILSALLEPDR